VATVETGSFVTDQVGNSSSHYRSFPGCGFSSPLVKTRGDYKPNLFVGKMLRMDRPAEIWNAERLERAMLAEAAGHGANKRDLDLLLTEFRNANKSNNRPVSEQVEIVGAIPP